MRKINTKIILSDCKKVLKTLDENSIDLIVTSPPYADMCFEKQTSRLKDAGEGDKYD
jgi:DNA modification methylase